MHLKFVFVLRLYLTKMPLQPILMALLPYLTPPTASRAREKNHGTVRQCKEKGVEHTVWANKRCNLDVPIETCWHLTLNLGREVRIYLSGEVRLPFDCVRAS